MKKRITAFALATAMVMGTVALAAGTEKNITVTPMTLSINGQVVTPTKSNGEAAEVFAYDGATYVPLRYLSELLGVNVEWDKANPDVAKLASDKITLPARPAVSFTPGTYTGEGQGFGGAITVSVTVNETNIVSVEVLENKETAGIGTTALERLPGKVVEGQGLNITAVSGCTYSSKGLLAAVEDALAKAGGDIALLKTLPSADEAGKGDTVRLSADVVIVGGGGAGLAAAQAAAEQGVKVIVLEKTAALGGTTLLSGAYYACGNQEVSKKAEMNDKMHGDVEAILALEPKNDDMARWQAAVKKQYADYKASGADYMFDSEEFHMLQVYADGNFTADTKLVERYCSSSYECYKWMEKSGFTWSSDIIAGKASDSGKVVLDAQRARRNKGEGKQRNSAMMIELFQNNGLAAKIPVEYMTEVSGKELIVDNGRVAGVRAEGSDGTSYVVEASKGVILATGGVGSNVALINEYNEWYPTLPDDFASDNSAGVTGDGLLMARTAGAELIDMEKVQMFVHGTSYYTGVNPYVCAYTNMMVNGEGKRFVNECADDRTLAAAMIGAGESYLLSDAGSTTITDGKTANGVDVEELISRGLLFRADSIEELAEKIGADPAGLSASVKSFNAICDAQKDEEFGRAKFIGSEKLTTAPFYATLTRPAEHHSMGGVHVDTDMRVLTAGGAPLPGLYAAGEICSGLNGEDRISGNAILEALCGGMIAGRSVVGDK